MHDASEDVRPKVASHLLHIVEGFHLSDIVYDDDSVRAAVVAAGDRAESLLPCRVPNLQLDGFSIELDGADFLRARWMAEYVRRADNDECG